MNANENTSQTRRLFTLLPLVIAVAVLGGCGPAAEDKDAEEGPSQPVEVSAVEARADTLRPTSEWVGALVVPPEGTAYAAPQLGGQVERVVVQEGQAVHAGDPIAILDARLALADRDKTRADADEAKAALALLERGALPVEIEAARQDARSAASSEEALQAKLKALEPLMARKEIAPVQYQQAEAALKAAQAARAASDAKLKLVEGGSRREAIAEAKAHVASVAADLAAKELAVGMCTLTSPIDGTVTELLARPGMAVQPSDRLATIVNLTRLDARFRVSGAMLAKLAEGAKAEVSVEGMEPVQVAVTRVGKVADPQTGDVEVLAAVPNDQGLLRPGLGCKVRLALPEAANAVVLPASAVADHNGTSVVTLIRDGKAYETEVVTGEHAGDLVHVLKGINPGDLVALEGGYGLPDGCPVVLRKPAKP